MKAIIRSTFVGVIVYIGFTFAAILATSGRLALAYFILFVVCIVGVYTGNIGSTNNEVNEK